MKCPHCNKEINLSPQTNGLYDNTEQKILSVLADNTEHRYLDILNNIPRLSPATLTKHLKQLVKDGKVKRRLDAESWQYPPPVYYIISHSSPV